MVRHLLIITRRDPKKFPRLQKEPPLTGPLISEN